MKLEEKMIWPFKTKITEKRNYDRKDLAFSFQSQITVLLPQLILAEQIHSPAFLEQARIQSSVVLGAPPILWSESFLDQRTVESRKAVSIRSTNDLFAISAVNDDEEE